MTAHAGRKQHKQQQHASMTDPVDLEPIPPLQDSYVFHSELPPEAVPGSDANKGGWIMGIDEAGRGREFPVLCSY